LPEPAPAAGEETGTAWDAEAEGEGQIRQWLFADPEFMRAADELLHDADPQVRRAGAALLRELGEAE
jgi:hypothetical protein